jgi:aspartokinase
MKIPMLPSSEKNRLLVMKFGGTSVGTGAAIGRVAGIVMDQWYRRPVVVVISAMSGVTDELLALVEYAAAGDDHACSRLLESLSERHLAAAHEIAPAGSWTLLHRKLAELGGAARDLLGNPLSRSQAEGCISGWGELLAVILVTGALEARGAPALACLEPLIVIRSDQGMRGALPDMEMMEELPWPCDGRWID